MAKTPDQVNPLSSPDRPTSLAALADRLAAELLVAEGSAVAALSKELRAVQAERDAIEPAEGDVLDDLEARRTARRSADLPDKTAVGDNRRPRGGRSRT